MKAKNQQKRGYHHGNLAESLLNAVDNIAAKFGLEAVTLRGCAKLVGVSPSSAFRHYVDKRALLTAFATRALYQLCDVMAEARDRAGAAQGDAFREVSIAYVRFAIEKPAFFRAMWREEAIYTNDKAYLAAADALSTHLKGGFADTIVDNDPDTLSAQELLAWSAVHGLANLFVDGPIGRDDTVEQKIHKAHQMIEALLPAYQTKASGK